MAGQSILRVALLAASVFPLSGCIAATAISVAAETVEAGVEITGAVIGTGVDLVTTSEEERERDRD